MSGRKTYDGTAITNKEFFTQACRWADSSNIQTAEKWWTAFTEVIIREMYYHRTIRMPNIGMFKVKEIPESVQTQRKQNGEINVYKVPARLLPIFEPSDDFIDDINMEGVTKAYRRREKNGDLSAKDITRKVRAETLGTSRKNNIMTKDKKDKAQKEFKEYLKTKKKKRNKERVKPENDEE